MAAVSAFRDPSLVASPEPTLDASTQYDELWAFWLGTWRSDPAMRSLQSTAPALYKNTRQLWRHADAIVSLYEQFVYAGDLSSDGRALPDGTRGAIPIDPQTGDNAADEAIRRGCAELWSMWRWRQSMALAPKYAAILGDCLLELVDDVGRGTVTPRFVWPGSVVDIDLSDAGDVRRYAIEYPVAVRESNAYGQRVRGETYRFRKEVDRESIRYYRDGDPAAFPGLGIPRAVEPNPYGFAPACWYRHEIVFGSRGVGALEKTFRAAQEMNSVLSHAIDYQRRQFSAPVGVIGGSAGAASRRAAPEPERGPEAAEREARAAAETMSLLSLQPGGQFVTVQFDVGQTTQMLQLVMDAILAEAPEARYAQQILGMTQVTAPGIERALGPIVGRVKRARANHDPQTVKLHQMALAMLGYRLTNGHYPARVVSERPARYEAFRPFDLGSYGRGLLDFTIPDRPVIPETAKERVDLALLRMQAGVDRVALAELGYDATEGEGGEPSEVDRIVAERRDAGEDAATQFARSFNANRLGA